MVNLNITYLIVVNNTRFLTLEVKSLQKEHDKIIIVKEQQIASYFLIRQQLEQLGKQFHTYLTKPQYIIPFLQPGRLVKVSYTKFYGV